MRTYRQFRFDRNLLDRFDRINNKRAVNGSELIRKFVTEYTNKEEEKMAKELAGKLFKKSVELGGDAVPFDVVTEEGTQTWVAYKTEDGYHVELEGDGDIAMTYKEAVDVLATIMADNPTAEIKIR